MILMLWLCAICLGREPTERFERSQVLETATPVKKKVRKRRVTPAVELYELYVPPDPQAIRVMIDLGHGGKDDGAIGVNGLKEKVLAAKVSYLIRRELNHYSRRTGFPLEVKLTRVHDVLIPLKERVRIANRWGADLFVSIHANASPTPEPKGFEVYFLSSEASDEQTARLALAENKEDNFPVDSDVYSILTDAKQTHHIAESSLFAETMYNEMAKRLKPNKRGVRQGPFTVLHGTSMPAVLVEVGYLTNPSNAKKLKKLRYLKRVAFAISSGIVKFAKSRVKKFG